MPHKLVLRLSSDIHQVGVGHRVEHVKGFHAQNPSCLLTIADAGAVGDQRGNQEKEKKQMSSHEQSPSEKNKDFKKRLAPWIDIVHNPRAVSLSTEKTPKRAILIDTQGVNA
jgi:hypothetical protein